MPSHARLQAQWQLARLIGRSTEQDQLQRLLREDIPRRRDHTIVISGPVGSGRVALARWTLGSVHAGTGVVTWFAADAPEKARLRRAFDAAVADVG